MPSHWFEALLLQTSESWVRNCNSGSHVKAPAHALGTSGSTGPSSSKLALAAVPSGAVMVSRGPCPWHGKPAQHQAAVAVTRADCPAGGKDCGRPSRSRSPSLNISGSTHLQGTSAQVRGDFVFKITLAGTGHCSSPPPPDDCPSDRSLLSPPHPCSAQMWR